MTDVVAPHMLTSRDNNPTYSNNGQPNVVTAQAAPAVVPTIAVEAGSYSAPAVIYQEKSHCWRNTFITLGCIAVACCIVGAIIHYSDDADDYDDE